MATSFSGSQIIVVAGFVSFVNGFITGQFPTKTVGQGAAATIEPTKAPAVPAGGELKKRAYNICSGWLDRGSSVPSCIAPDTCMFATQSSSYYWGCATTYAEYDNTACQNYPQTASTVSGIRQTICNSVSSLCGTAQMVFAVGTTYTNFACFTFMNDGVYTLKTAPIGETPTIVNGLFTYAPLPAFDFSACSTVSLALSSCESITPGFTVLEPSSQASCLCYSTSSWMPVYSDGFVSSSSWIPDYFDGFVSSCAQFVSSYEPEIYTGIVPLEDFCHSVGPQTSSLSSPSSSITGSNSSLSSKKSTATGCLATATNASQCNSPSTPIGAIIGGVIGGMALLAFIAFLLWFFIRKRREDRIKTTPSNLDTDGNNNLQPATIHQNTIPSPVKDSNGDNRSPGATSTAQSLAPAYSPGQYARTETIATSPSRFPAPWEENAELEGRCVGHQQVSELEGNQLASELGDTSYRPPYRLSP